MSNRNNYRIYDCTGGGVTHDIYAATLEAAIDAGRAWIEDGDWASEDGVIRKGATLDACVREILRTVYYVDRYREGLPRDIRGPYCSLEAARDALTVGEQEVSMDPCDGVVAQLKSAHDGSDVSLVESWATESESDADCIYSVTGQLVDGEIDRDATDAGQENDCSGSHSDEEPECAEGGGEDEGGHAWVSPHELVGGCKENPGVFGGSGTSMTIIHVCALCGCKRTERHAGSQRNPGEPDSVVEYEDPEEETKEWMVMYHAEDGWIPQWLADRLDISPTVRFTEQQAKEYVAEHDDDDELDAEDLEHLFAALFGRRADERERSIGIWSYCVPMAAN